MDETQEWASEDILTPEVLAAFQQASEELLALRQQAKRFEPDLRPLARSGD